MECFFDYKLAGCVFDSDGTAAWAQAISSVLAIIFAGWFASTEHKRASKAADKKSRGIALGIVQLIKDFVNAVPDPKLRMAECVDHMQETEFKDRAHELYQMLLGFHVFSFDSVDCFVAIDNIKGPYVDFEIFGVAEANGMRMGINTHEKLVEYIEKLKEALRKAENVLCGQGEIG